MKRVLTLDILPDAFAVCRLDAVDALPGWINESSFLSITRTSDELSIVCEQIHVPSGVKMEPGWRCLKVKGPIDFGLTGVLASLANPLAKAGISIFAISTFGTDYLLVKEKDLQQAGSVLIEAGHKIMEATQNCQ